MSPAPPRAMWVWSRPDPSALVSWARMQRVGTAFVEVPPALPTSPELPWVTSLVAAARAADVRVTALGADKSWLVDPGAAVAWQRSVAQTGLFDGVHVNVEPWAEGCEWARRRPELVSQFLRLLRALRAATELELEVDLAFWLHGVPTDEGISLDRAAMRLVDAVTLMSYRDRADGVDGILDVARRSLAAAAELGVPCRLAVETVYLGTTPVENKQTFYEEGAAALVRETARVETVAGASMAYAGIAVHQYDAWRALRP